MHSVILVTVSSKKEADRIALALIKEKLAACVNISDRIESVYWWEGKVVKSRELLLVIKTRKALVKRLIKKIKSLHSYTVPEIIALPVISGNKEYLGWINDATR
ncbi:MAG: divalent-cation tolerance protein CutA [Candidatus Omnitrophica bacterium]|nr:divalent-cation tolerance protein CutA [Candidatus Omnitrophota bacterium]